MYPYIHEIGWLYILKHHLPHKALFSSSLQCIVIVADTVTIEAASLEEQMRQITVSVLGANCSRNLLSVSWLM